MGFALMVVTQGNCPRTAGRILRANFFRPRWGKVFRWGREGEFWRFTLGRFVRVLTNAATVGVILERTGLGQHVVCNVATMREALDDPIPRVRNPRSFLRSIRASHR